VGSRRSSFHFIALYSVYPSIRVFSEHDISVINVVLFAN
jgi:hypothetical protein